MTRAKLALFIAITALCVALSGCAAQNGVPLSEGMDSSLPFAENIADINESLDSDTPATPFADALTASLTEIASSSPMHVAITFVDLKNPIDTCSVNGDRPQRSASTIKLLVLNEFFNQVDQGLIDLDETHVLSYSDIVGGTGVLQGRGVGSTTTFREMAELMISASDNVATNVIIDRLGMDSINERAAELGLSSTSLNRRMMDAASIAAGIENYMSSQDAATLLRMVYDGTFGSAEANTFARAALEAQTDGTGILEGLPEECLFAHKTGALPDAQNDCGIVFCSHDFVLSVFCESGEAGGFSATEARDIMARCARCVTDTLIV